MEDDEADGGSRCQRCQRCQKSRILDSNDEIDEDSETDDGDDEDSYTKMAGNARNAIEVRSNDIHQKVPLHDDPAPEGKGRRKRLRERRESAA